MGAVEIQKSDWQPNMAGFTENGFWHYYGRVSMSFVEFVNFGQDYSSDTPAFHFMEQPGVYNSSLTGCSFKDGYHSAVRFGSQASVTVTDLVINRCPGPVASEPS